MADSYEEVVRKAIPLLDDLVRAAGESHELGLNTIGPGDSDDLARNDWLGDCVRRCSEILDEIRTLPPTGGASGAEAMKQECENVVYEYMTSDEHDNANQMLLDVARGIKALPLPALDAARERFAVGAWEFMEVMGPDTPLMDGLTTVGQRRYRTMMDLYRAALQAEQAESGK